jgi:hypothetical protein
MKLIKTDTRNGLIILYLEDERGTHEIELTSMNVEDLIGALRASQEEAIGHSSAHNYTRPGIHRVQYVQTPETLYFRIFLNERLYHEYPIDRDPPIAATLRIKIFRDAAFRQANEFGERRMRAAGSA